MDGDTEESCTQYNILKVSRHMFTWTADPRLADFYERAFFNGIVGNQNLDVPEAWGPNTVGFEYMLPLGGPQLHKPYAVAGPDADFPCCWGTLSETYAKLGDSVYFASEDGSTLFVNLFVSSRVRWRNHTITQSAGFPASTNETTIITLVADAEPALEVILAIRVPFWATGANTVTVNGQSVGARIVVGDYLHVVARGGDVVFVHFPMSLRFEQLDDKRPQFSGVGAVMYGPLMLAGITSTDQLLLMNRTLDQAVKRTYCRLCRRLCDADACPHPSPGLTSLGMGLALSLELW